MERHYLRNRRYYPLYYLFNYTITWNIYGIRKRLLPNKHTNIPYYVSRPLNVI